MPRYDERDSPSAIREELGRKIDRLTRVACDMWGVIKHNGLTHRLTSESRSWGVDHDAADARREARQERLLKNEERKRAALRKLTSEDKKLLGLM